MARRVAIGNFPDGHAGMRVSKAGFDALMNPVVAADMMFNSDWASCFPIHFSVVSAVSGSSSTTFTYPTALSYVPFMAFCYKQSSQWNVGSTGGNLVEGGYGMPMFSTNSNFPATPVYATSTYAAIVDPAGNQITEVAIVVFRVPAF